MNINSASKKSCIIGILVFLSLCIYAGEININWTWSPSEEGITHYRYQKDGEEEGAWKVVDATVTSYSVGPVDASIRHILFIQQSYDGIHWGPSGSVVYDPETYEYPELEQGLPYKDAEPTVTHQYDTDSINDDDVTVTDDADPVDADPVDADRVDADRVDADRVDADPVDADRVDADPVDADPADDDPADDDPADVDPVDPDLIDVEQVDPDPVESESAEFDNNNPNLIQFPFRLATDDTDHSRSSLMGPRSGVELSFGLGNLSGIDASNTYADLPGIIFPAVSLDFLLHNLVSYTNNFDLGLIAGLGFQFYSPQTSAVQFLDLHALITLRYALQNNLSLRLGIGTIVLTPYADLSQNTVSFFNSSNINIFYGFASKLTLQYAFSDSINLGLHIDGRLLFSDAFVPYELSGFLGLVLGYRF